jgi:hypothetical protein
MKALVSAALLLVVAVPLAHGKDKKKSAIPAVFANAHYVYVQSEDGDIMKPGLFPEDREAIANVQDAVKEWKRYVVTINRRDADLVFIVRKGRLAAVQPYGGVGIGNAPPNATAGSYPNRNAPGPNNPNADQTNSGTEIGARSDVGPSDDLLRVYTQTPDGRLNGPLWSREIKDGLDTPNVLLVRVLREAVEKAYPPQAAAQPAPPTQP